MPNKAFEEALQKERVKGASPFPQKKKKKYDGTDKKSKMSFSEAFKRLKK